jgi:hypothetical protein
MTGIRRVLILIGLTLAIIVGASIPASATFAESVTVNSTVSTFTVQPPASVSNNGIQCVSREVWDGTASVTVWELQVNMSWTASATATTKYGISGYRVTASSSSSTYPIATVDPTTFSVADTIPIQRTNANIRVTVVTLTSFGWVSAELAPSGNIKCS